MKQVYRFLDNLLKLNDKVIVACSGGPDSMCLLNIILEYKDRLNLDIICAHVNHNVRLASQEEQAYVAKFCQEHSITFESMKIEKYNNTNFHADARNKRYQFLNELVNKYKANYVMTAHHGDDLIETMLMKIIRGSSLKGIAGINLITDYSNYKLVRPLLFVTKQDCLNYNSKNKIKYYIDESNNTDDYLRNRLRHHILPTLKSENPLVHHKFLEFSNELFLIDNFLDNYLSNILTNIYINGKLFITEFIKLDDLLKYQVIKYILKDYYCDLAKLNKKHLKAIYDLIHSVKTSGSIDLPNNLQATKSYDVFEIKEKQDYQDYCYKLDDNIKIANYGTFKIVSKSQLTNNYVCYLDSTKIKLPLYIRNRRMGDKIWVKNMNGHQKIKDVFINAKVAKEKRNNYPLLVDSDNNILWVPGLKKSNFDSYLTKHCDIIIWYEEEKNEK